MTEEASTLYAKLLGETAKISWEELAPFFARGNLLKVAACADLVEVAIGVAEDDKVKVAAWLTRGDLSKVDEIQAQDYLERDPELWAVVIAPWVLVQERVRKDVLH
ncbi:DUF2288 domain-containing protein [Pseudomonas nicosulfuronedens]